MESKREHILNYARKRFMESGYSKVSVEEIAHACRLGKATIYQEFGSKEELLLSSIKSFADHLKQKMDPVLVEGNMSLDEKIQALLHLLFNTLTHVNTAALDDIRRSVPEAFDLIEEERRGLIFENITKIITEGRNNGTFRQDTDPKLIAHMMIGAVSHIADPHVLVQFDTSPARTLEMVVSIIIRGCIA
jgi:TetR/AcrR family fatty acid metabolism transcriptional regulator